MTNKELFNGNMYAVQRITTSIMTDKNDEVEGVTIDTYNGGWTMFFTTGAFDQFLVLMNKLKEDLDNEPPISK